MLFAASAEGLPSLGSVDLRKADGDRLRSFHAAASGQGVSVRHANHKAEQQGD
jgi:hypothetical protein